MDYELTELGHSLQGTLTQLSPWAFDHQDDVAMARAAYDSAAGT